MVYLVGGYKLTDEQVYEWCLPYNLHPDDDNLTSVVNTWFREQRLQLVLLACDYEGECISLLVTDRKVDISATRTKFKAFEETDRARKIKEKMGIEPVEFVTVADPYGYASY